MLLGLLLISAIAGPRQVRKLPRCESGGGRVLCPYYSCRCRRATTAMPEISEFKFATDSPWREMDSNSGFRASGDPPHRPRGEAASHRSRLPLRRDAMFEYGFPPPR